MTLDAHQFRLNWLESLSFPTPENDKIRVSEDSGSCNADSGWVVAVDPDLSGALAVLNPDGSPQVVYMLRCVYLICCVLEVYLMLFMLYIAVIIRFVLLLFYIRIVKFD